MTIHPSIQDLSERVVLVPDEDVHRSSTSSDRVPNRWAVAFVRRGAPLIGVAAKKAIVGRNRSRTDPTAGRFTKHDVSDFVSAAFDDFGRQVPGLPAEPTVGSRQNVMLAALTLSLLDTLERGGVERDYAIELTGDTCWRFYRQWGQVTKTVSGFISRDPTRRLRLSVNAFLSYPFGRPGYRFDDVPEEDGRSLNMVRCPVADYLGGRGAADLCAGSWCNLDYALAEMWGASLERSTTLVAGDSRCDFRFHMAPPARSDTSVHPPVESPAQLVALRSHFTGATNGSAHG
jgi:ubiquinone biosynthesis protein